MTAETDRSGPSATTFPDPRAGEMLMRSGIPVCSHPDTWFDRSICFRDDWMHTRCKDCGVPLDGNCAEVGVR